MRLRRCVARALVVGLATAVGLVGCTAGSGQLAGIGPQPVVKAFTYVQPTPGALRSVAVVPFYPRTPVGTSVGRSAARPVSPTDAATFVANHVAEAFAARGISVIPAHDVDAAFLAMGIPTPRLDARATADLAHRELGASAVLLGEVLRYRERGGEAIGSTSPGSVAFTLTLYTAPGAVRLWTARFDETQRPLTENVFNAQRYPGGGTRWLTAGELARWGADAAAAALPRPKAPAPAAK